MLNREHAYHVQNVTKAYPTCRLTDSLSEKQADSRNKLTLVLTTRSGHQSFSVARTRADSMLTMHAFH